MIRSEGGEILIRGIIVETEAYSQEEESCHGFRKKTNSNKSLFGEPGTFYIYKTYGIHNCFNVVTDKTNFASGVLIRSVFIAGEEERKASGPGLVTKRFFIDKKFDGLNNTNNKYLKITQRDIAIKNNDLIQTTRVGISKAIDLKWRWYMKNSRSISKRAKGDHNPKLINQISHSDYKH